MIIKEVVLYTDRLVELKDFYLAKLNLRIANASETAFTIQTPLTNLIFQYSSEYDNPFYHFAFNIPENQFKQAKDWALQRVDLIKLDGEDEFDFKSWNAHSIYFYDPAGNIIELIERHNLNNKSHDEFSGKSLLSISEIGFPVYDVGIFFNEINNFFNIPEFSGDRKTFCAAGDDNGLFIIVNNGRKWFPDCPDAKIFPTTVKIESDEKKEIEFRKLSYKIISVV